MKKINFGLIGVGYLGKYHLKHLLKFDFINLVGIHDTNQKLMVDLSKKYNVNYYASLNELLNQIDAACIVTPTNCHAEIARIALKSNCHIFIEKPISHSLKSANKILKQTKQQKKIAHVGHIERFNPAFKAFMATPRKPLFLECHRLTKINNRSMDISVISDLMIHDIDLLIHMINSPIKSIIADGIKVISNNIDLANVKLIFENECIANLTASRISNKNMRKIRVFENKKYTSIDLLNKEIEEYSAIQDKATNQLTFKESHTPIDNYDALEKELRYFYQAIKNNDLSTDNITNAIHALDIAEKINTIIEDKGSS